MKFFLSALTLLMVTLASADKASLRANIKAQLQMGGAYNCQYKCANLFNIQSLWDVQNGNTQLNQMSRDSVSILNEYLGCAAGCDLCGGGENGQCASQCKNKNWENTVWWYNPHSGTSKFVEVNQDLLQQQADCVEKCGTMETGGRAILSDDFTECTTNCYNDETFGIKKINDDAQAICKRDRTCDSINEKGECLKADGSVQENTPLNQRYTAAMCGAGVLKNIIEPDKACQFGCDINLCQMGAGCLGKGAWSAETDLKHCQVITPQLKGVKYTIVPDIFIRPGQDLAGCCTQSRVCCSYKQGWAKSYQRQRQGVCTVANNYENCGSGVPNFEIKDFGGDISKGAFPGNGCSELWKPKGVCEGAGYASCPECRQDNHA